MFINFNLINASNNFSITNFEGRQKTKNIVEKATRRAYNRVDYDSIDIKKVKSLIKKGYSLSQIGETIGQSVNAVRSFLKRFGLKTKEGELLSNVNEAELLQMLDSGLSQKEIANYYGFTNIAALTPLIRKLGYNVTPTHTKVANIPASELEALINEGRSYENIAKLYNVAPIYITKRCRSLGLKTKTDVIKDKIVAKEILEFAMKFDLSKGKLAEKLHITVAKLNQLLKEYGIESKSEIEQKKGPVITIDQLKEQLAKYRTKKEICENLNIQSYQLNSLLKKYGLEIDKNLPPSEKELRSVISCLASQVTHRKEYYPQKETKRSYKSAYIFNVLCGKFNLTPRKMEKLIKQYDLNAYIDESAKRIHLR